MNFSILIYAVARVALPRLPHLCTQPIDVLAECANSVWCG
jgi:hypothetical protein